MYNLQEIVHSVLKDKRLCDKYIDDFENGIDMSEFNHDKCIDEILLIELIKKSHGCKILSLFLSAFVIYLRKEEISCRIFDMLINYRGAYRKSILIGLAHCDLSFYQLYKLNKLNIDDNPFCRLLELYICNNVFSVYDLENFIAENSNKDVALYKYIIQSISFEDIAKDKLLILNKHFGGVI